MARRLLPLAVFLGAFALMWISTPNPRDTHDYTRRVAAALLRGNLGVSQKPPSWLNEFVPHNGRYHSVFPLGSVLSIVPFTWATSAKFVRPFPLRFIIAAIAAGITTFAFLLAARHQLPWEKHLAFALAPLFGTCLWPNLAFGAAWQIALGFAVLGSLGALFFATGPRPRPFLAGCCFALAFGNRTEILLTAPALYYILLRTNPPDSVRRFTAFSLVPAILGFATLAYNAARFGSPFDFGYARIPGVLDEPWYRDGIFAISAIPRNAYAMLIEPWKALPNFPWLVPSGWGGSIFLSSPFLILLFTRWRCSDPALRVTAWSAIAVMTLLHWLHGNPGGWQVSYRYASVLIPWALLLLIESEPTRRASATAPLIVLAIAINAWSNFIFNQTNLMTP